MDPDSTEREDTELEVETTRSSLAMLEKNRETWGYSLFKVRAQI